jgi:cell division protein FtsI/penicillin-binding protein 2
MEERRRIFATLIVALIILVGALLAIRWWISRPEPEPRESVDLAQYRAAALDRRRGIYPFVFDRDGNPLAPDKNFQPFVATLASRRLGLKDRITTTLDSDVQHAAVTALGDLKASLVAIDPRTNEVLAVASTGPDSFERQYEPGSVIKVLTLLAALSSGLDVPSMFPFECHGALPIDGRSFGDWHPGGHGRLPDLDEALAESCNVAFAAIGLKTGRDRLRAFHQRAGFDGQTNLGLFRVTLGKTVGTIFNNFETGFYSIGLEHETVTTFHLAMLASMLANRGALTTPRIYRSRRTISGRDINPPPKQTTDQIAPPAAAARVAAAMQAVVTRPKGTGRRAMVDGVPLALKTGTAGSPEQGYDALVIGFAPADHPKIAFALIAENAGAAEFAAAKAAHDFVEGLRASGHL